MKPQPSGGFEWVQAAGGPALVCGALRPFADHLYTTRDWALGSRAEAADEDWEPVAASLGVDSAHLARVHQVHGNTVFTVRLKADATTDATQVRLKPDATTDATQVRLKPDATTDADIIVSNDPSIALAIQVADCVPLLMADRLTGAVAAAHAGWRGLAAGVPGATVAALTREFESRPSDLVVAIGPCISAAAYEVGDDVRASFACAGGSADHLARWFRNGNRAGHWSFDLWQAARDQLEGAGVPAAQIHLSALCTAGYPGLLCSYRREGKGAGRIAAAIRCASPRP